VADGHELAMALRGAYLAMHRRSDARFARRGVTADQFVLLDALVGNNAVTQRELARRTGSDPNTVRAMLVLLEERGLVTRAQHPTDGRARIVTLTPAGRAAYRQLWRDSEPVRNRLLSALRPGEADTLLGLLTRLTTAMAPADAASSPARTRK
jgi:DNA-binding MarR family transcriptional regulator